MCSNIYDISKITPTQDIAIFMTPSIVFEFLIIAGPAGKSNGISNIYCSCVVVFRYGRSFGEKNLKLICNLFGILP